MSQRFKFNIPENYAVDLEYEPELDGVVFSGPNGIIEIAFQYLDGRTIAESIKGFLDGIEVPFEMISEVEQINIDKLEGCCCRYAVEGEYTYEIDLGIDVPDACYGEDVLSILLASDSKENLEALEKDVNIAALVKVC